MDAVQWKELRYHSQSSAIFLLTLNGWVLQTHDFLFLEYLYYILLFLFFFCYLFSTSLSVTSIFFSYSFFLLFLFDFIIIPIFLLFGLAGRMFANSPGDRVSVPGQVIPKTLKMVLCWTLSLIRYVSMVKWSNPGKGVTPSSKPRCCSYWKGSLRVALNWGC